MTDEVEDIYDICLEKKSLCCIRKMGEETCSKCKTYQMYKLGLESRKDLEEENARLSNSVTELTNMNTELENKVTELEKQIKKMKSENNSCSDVMCEDCNKECELKKILGENN